MRKAYILSMAFVLLCTGISKAQDKKITGTVSSEEGETLPGVTVVVTGTSIGDITGVDGKYEINVPEDAISLTFSYVGMQKLVEPIEGRSLINVQMVPDLVGLDEVVVVAYGAQSRKSLTGSVGTVDEELIENQQVISVGRALQGTTPGVNVITGIGQPGENPIIRIRGISSVNASAAPLIVVDNVPYSGNLSSINPNDVESVSVLKDASSSALYGSRAANGVVMITTKKGKTGEPRINFRTSYGISNRAVPEYDFISSEDYMKLAWEALRFEGMEIELPEGQTPGQYASSQLIANLRYNPYVISEPIDASGNLKPGAELKWNTDWENLLTNDDARKQLYSLDIGGGDEKTTYFISGSYLDQEGYAITSKYKRYTGRVNIETKLRKWLSAGINANLSYSDQNVPNQEGTPFANNIQFIRSMASIYPLYQRDDNGELVVDEQGNPLYDFGQNSESRSVNEARPVLNPSNLVATTYLNDIQRERYNTGVNSYLDFKFTDFLSFKTNFAIDHYVFDRFDYDNPDNGDGENVKGRVQRQKNITNFWTWYNQLLFEQAFGSHTVTATAIGEAYNYTYEYLNAQKTGFPFNGLKEFNAAASLEDLSGYTNQTRLASILGRVGYDYQKRYYLEFSGRNDASSRFSKENRNGTFFSAGATWIISEESFLSGMTSLNLLKLRASYGQVGNNDLLDQNQVNLNNVLDERQLSSFFPYLYILETGYDDLTNSGVFLESLSNPLITWEKVSNLNIGVDFGIFNNRLSGSVDWYEKITTDMLFNRPLAPSVGEPIIPENYGDLKNTGVELQLNSVNVRNSDFNWQTSFNIAFESNELIKLPQEEIIQGSKKLEVGKSIFEFYIQEWAGVDPDDGAAMWYMDVVDENGNVTGKETTKDYDQATRYYQGSALPKARGGLHNSLNFKGIEFSFLFNYSIGGKILDYDYAGLMHGYNKMGYQLHSNILDRWQQPGDNTDVPRLNTGNSDVDQRSSRFLFDNTYIRLRNVTLAYSFNESVLSSIGFIQKLTIKAQADNYWTWSQHPGLDPEQNIGGTTDNRSSIFKTISFGLNVGF